MAESRQLFSDTRATSHPPGSADSSPSGEKHVLGPQVSEHSGQSRASHSGVLPPLRGHDGHQSSSWYCRRCVRPIIQRPVGHQAALGELKCGTLPARPQRCVHDSRRSRHSLSSSRLVQSLLPVHQLLNFNTLPQMTRVTAGGTVILELQSLVIHSFGSHPAYSSDPIPLTLAWHRLSQSGNSDIVAEDYHMLRNCLLRIIRRARLCFERPLKLLAALVWQRNT